MPDAQTVLWTFLALFGLQFALERALEILNIRHVLKNRDRIPDAAKGAVSPETYQKSVDYTLARARFGQFAAFFDAALSLFLLFSGALPWVWRRIVETGAGDGTTGVLFFGAVALFLSLIRLPLSLYSTFAVEARFGFNKTDLRTFVLDRLKGLLLLAVLGVPFAYGLLAFVTATGRFWWLWAALFMVGFQLLMLVLYPLLIAPFFNTFKPLEDGEPKACLTRLAQTCGFAARGIFVMDGSKRSSHSNAYFTGFGKARRIVLFDTLIEQLSTPELAAVLAHEIGHYKRRHIPKTMLLGILATLLGFYVLSLLIGWPPLYQAFGFDAPSPAVGLLLFSVVSGPFTFWADPLFNALSRRHEYDADAYAAQWTDAGSMAGALLKLHEKNLANLTPHPAYSAYHYSHPTLVERLAALNRASGGGSPA